MALEQYAKRVEEREGVKVYIVEPNSLRAVVEALHREGYDYLLSISGVDEPKAKRIRVVYHFTRSSDSRSIIAVEVSVPRDKPVVPSISDLYPAAAIQEREEHEMLGIIFEGLHDARHLLLPEDWPEGSYPLRKDFVVREEPFMSTKPSKPLEELKKALEAGGAAEAS